LKKDPAAPLEQEEQELWRHFSAQRQKRRRRRGLWRLFLPLILAFVAAAWLAYLLASPHHRQESSGPSEIDISWSDAADKRRPSASPDEDGNLEARQSLTKWHAEIFVPAMEPLIGSFAVYEATDKALDLETREACLRLRQTVGETGRQVIRSCPEALLELHLAELFSYLDRLVQACVEKKPYAALEAQELTSAKLEELDRALRSYGLDR
jgi:hypothetical protein